MIVVRTVTELRAELHPFRARGCRIGFVPTMGALHEGHLSLVRAAAAACETVVLSIFVNPLQFGPLEDLDAYPRDEAADFDLAQHRGVDVVFCPAVSEMYPHGSSTKVAVGPIGDVLEGEVRPGHFTGVATVVAKLFNIVEPHAAFFGQKDAQQLAVIRRMSSDLCFDVDIVSCPTVRATDGVALSSRNRYLSAEERLHATVLRRSLQEGERVLYATQRVEDAEKAMWDLLISEDSVEADYAAAVDPVSFGRPRAGGPILLAVAARVGATRLLDNTLVQAREEP
jgi:pantoate--beta-alanine ligase